MWNNTLSSWVFPTMKSLDSDKKAPKTVKSSVSEAAPVKEVIDFSNVKIEPLLKKK